MNSKNLKKVLSTSVASLTVLSTLSGSVSTKIYACPIESATNKEIYGVKIMDGDKISSVRFVYNLLDDNGIILDDNGIIVNVPFNPNDKSSQQSAEAFVNILNSDGVGKVLRRDSKITNELAGENIIAYTFHFTEADIADMNSEKITAEDKRNKITKVLTSGENGKLISWIEKNQEDIFSGNAASIDNATQQPQAVDETAPGIEIKEENKTPVITAAPVEVVELEGQTEEGIESNESTVTNLPTDIQPQANDIKMSTKPLVYAETIPVDDECNVLNFYCDINGCDINGCKCKIRVFYDIGNGNTYHNEKEIENLIKIINIPMVGKKLKGEIGSDLDVEYYFCVDFNDDTIKEIRKVAKGLGPEDTEANRKKASNVCNEIIGVIKGNKCYQTYVLGIEPTTEPTSYFGSADTLQPNPDLEFTYDGHKCKLYCSEQAKESYPDDSKEIISLSSKIIKEAGISDEKSGTKEEINIKIYACDVDIAKKLLNTIAKKPEKIKGILSLYIENTKKSNSEKGLTVKFYEKDKLHPSEKNSQNILECPYGKYKIDCSKVAENYPEIMKEIKNDFNEIVRNASEEKKGEYILTINDLNGLRFLETNLFLQAQEGGLDDFLDYMRENAIHESGKTDIDTPSESESAAGGNTVTNLPQTQQKHISGQSSNGVTEESKESSQAHVTNDETQHEKTETSSKNSFSTEESKTSGLFSLIWNSIKKFLSNLPLIGKFFK